MRSKAAQIIPRISRRYTMDIDEQIQHQKELAERRKIWEEQRKAEAEQQARQEKQGRMEAFLTSRRQAWIDHTGSLPPSEVTISWRMEYLAERAADEEAERALRLAEAAGNSPL
jgi:hypothetical protein